MTKMDVQNTCGVLVFGASGMLGRNLCAILQKNGIPFTGTYHSKPIADGVRFSFSNHTRMEQELDDFVRAHRPSVCVNCVVERFVEVCERDWEHTRFLNVIATRMLARVCSRQGIHLLHISTDYVFDGSPDGPTGPGGPYTPSSQVHPLQNYGISKLLAEYEVQACSLSYTIVRVPVLYTDDYTDLEESAVTAIAKKVMNRVETHYEDDVCIRRPLFVPDLCEFLLHIVQNTNRYKNRIHHFFQTDNPSTKYRIATVIGRILGKNTGHVLPQTSLADNPAAPRPYDTWLTDAGYDRDAFPNTSLLTGLDRCLGRFRHPRLSVADPTEVCVLIDLDGTLVDTEPLHHRAYVEALRECAPGAASLSYQEFLEETHCGDWAGRLLAVCNNDDDTFQRVCARKREIMCSYKDNDPIAFMPGMEQLIRTILDRRLPYVVVTNTSRETVEWMRGRLPLLRELRNWITREDVPLPKPDPLCYEMALRTYGNGAGCVVAFENTFHGWQSVRHVADVVYIITDRTSPSYPLLKKKDVFLWKEYTSEI